MIRVSGAFSSLLTKHPGLLFGRRCHGGCQPTYVLNFQAERRERKDNWFQKPLAWLKRLLQGLFHSPSIKWHSSDWPSTTREGEGWALHCYANKMQKKKSRTPGAPSNSGLRESPKMFLPHVQDIKISLKLIWGAVWHCHMSGAGAGPPPIQLTS